VSWPPPPPNREMAILGWSLLALGFLLLVSGTAVGVVLVASGGAMAGRYTKRRRSSS
jgi:hypothetical protein